MSFNFTVKEFILGNGTGIPTLQFYRRGFNLGSSGSSPEWQDIVLSGTGSLTLTNAKANGLNYVKLFGKCEQRNLPAGHTQLEYVYMTEGSCIRIEDLPISSGYKVEFEFQTTTLSSNLRNYIGGRANGVSAGGGVRLSKLASGGTTLNRACFYGFEAGTEYYAPEQFQPNTRYKYTYDNGVCTLESGGSVVSTQTFTVTDNTSTNWGINDYTSSGSWSGYHEPIYVYSVKVWNPQGELVMDLVPDLTSSNVVCFYDMVTGNIREASVGTFEAGTVAVPTPDYPMDIVSNNGVLKFGKPITIDNTRNYAYINTIGSWAWSSDSYSIALPVTVGEKYRIIISSTDSSIVGTIFRYGFTDSDPEEFKQSEVTPSPTSISIYDFWRGTPQDLSDVEVTATHPYMIIQFAAAYASTVVSTYLTVIDQSIYTDGTVETVKDSLDNTATAEMLLKVGDYQDIQSVLDGEVTRNIGVNILDGTETWTRMEPSSGVPFATFNLTLSTSAVGGVSNVPRCSHFRSATSTGRSNIPDNGVGVTANSTYTTMWFRCDSITTKDDFTAWLVSQYNAGTPVVILYPLATATTESVTGQHLDIQAGSNVIEITQASIDNLELEVSYKGTI